MDKDVSQEDLEAAAELYDNLVAGTHYQPGDRFIGEGEEDA